MPTRFPFGSTTGQIGHLQPNRAGGPTINRGKGNNNAATLWAFVSAAESKFGALDWDLAASAQNAKADLFIDQATDSLKSSWHDLPVSVPGRAWSLLFLNPPFTNITPWARKCAEECQLGARILLLVPASVGANWYWDWVVPFADVYSVGRMVFDDCYDKAGKLITTPYPKDLILCHYDWTPRYVTGHANGVGELIRWRWPHGSQG